MLAKVVDLCPVVAAARRISPGQNVEWVHSFANDRWIAVLEQVRHDLLPVSVHANQS